MKYTLREFLEERGCLGKYARNRLRDIQGTDDWYRHVHEDDASNYINRGFYWVSTPEGNFFWARWHDEWEEECRTRDLEVEAGMPLNDQLGLTLLSMEDGDDEA